MTVAIADAILTGSDYGEKLREWYRLYPGRGYGSGFHKWAGSKEMCYRSSMGNGSAMRVSPVGFAFDTLEKVLEEATQTAVPSHNHPEGIKGAQAVASAVFLARTGKSKIEIRTYVEETFGYSLREPLDDIRPHYRFDVTCPGSVPQAITAFLESDDYEDAVRKAISIGGDSDTIACMAGGIAQAFYGTVPVDITARVFTILDQRLTTITGQFMERHVLPYHKAKDHG